MARVFVTGASGFIGGAIAQRLNEEHEVLAMSRSERSDAAIRALGAEPVRCDLLGLEPGNMPSCDFVVHAAAWVEPWGKREDFWRANVEGTDRVLAAARTAGAKRLIHISTEAVLWRGQHLRDVDETYPYPESTPYLYAETKGEAERHVLAASAGEGPEAIVLRPRFVWGPGDRTLVPEASEMVEKGAWVWLDGGRAKTSTTHIDNLVHAVVLALTAGDPGEVYFITDGEITSFRDFVTPVMAAHGVTMPDRSLPSFIVRPAAAALEGVWQALGIERQPPLTRHAVDMLSCDCTVRDDKARKALGYAPVISVEEGLRQLAAAS